MLTVKCNCDVCQVELVNWCNRVTVSMRENIPSFPEHSCNYVRSGDGISFKIPQTYYLCDQCALPLLDQLKERKNVQN